MTTTKDTLQKKLTDKSALIGVVGLGYVGLPLALAFAEKGFRVLGFDVDQTKATMINDGVGYIQHLDSARVAAVVQKGLLSATAEFEKLGEPDAVLVCVPTPLTKQRQPALHYVEETSERIGSVLREGQLVVLESTTYPGTTDELVKSTLDRSGLQLGEQYFLAFSPEREDPGRKDFTTTTIPKVVGGVDPDSGELAALLYEQIISKVVRVSHSRVAEASKLTENIYRAVNIALVNELKVVFDRMGINVWEVLDAAETKPFGFKRFNPGPGWGGHCIPLDPFYLTWKAREYGLSTRFIELAGEVNVQMPAYVIEKLQLALNDRKQALRGSRVLVLGIAYKKDIDDPRESPAFEIMDRLVHLGADVSFHDPHINEMPRMRSWPDLPQLTSVPLSEATLQQVEAVVLVTDHSSVDYEFVAAKAPLVVDTRGIFKEPRANVVRA